MKFIRVWRAPISLVCSVGLLACVVQHGRLLPTLSTGFVIILSIDTSCIIRFLFHGLFLQNFGE
jgi:hypothetical protein